MTFIKCSLSRNIICVTCSETREVWYNESFSVSFVEFALDKFKNTGTVTITVEKLNELF